MFQISKLVVEDNLFHKFPLIPPSIITILSSSNRKLNARKFNQEIFTFWFFSIHGGFSFEERLSCLNFCWYRVSQLLLAPVLKIAIG